MAGSGRRKGPVLQVYLSEDEYAYIKDAAVAAHLTASTWARLELLRAAGFAEKHFISVITPKDGTE